MFTLDLLAVLTGSSSLLDLAVHVRAESVLNKLEIFMTQSYNNSYKIKKKFRRLSETGMFQAFVDFYIE